MEIFWQAEENDRIIYPVKKFVLFERELNMVINYEKLKYMLHFQRFDIELLIENVIEDSLEDPHYSAVTATNLVKCYIEIMQELGEKLPYTNVEGFMKAIGFSTEDYLLFEKKRSQESKYYLGVQY